jgi:hypothetical protein
MHRPRADRPTFCAAPGVSPAAGRPLPLAEAGELLDLSGDERPPHDFDRYDPRFREQLAASVPAVAAVGRYLEALGYPVVIPETRVRPTPAERAAYRDRGDGYVGRVFEVKWCEGFSFSSHETFPFRSVLLGNVYEFKRPGPPPWLVFSVSQDRRCALMVNVARTRAEWETWPLPAPRFGPGALEDCYFCPKELALLVELPPEDA